MPSSGGGGSAAPSGAQDAPAAGEVESLRAEVAGLRAALASRATIDQARGILVARYRISPDQAFRVLVRWSQHRNIRLRTIAETLVGLSHDGPDGPDADLPLRRWLEQQLSEPATAGDAGSASLDSQAGR